MVKRSKQPPSDDELESENSMEQSQDEEEEDEEDIDEELALPSILLGVDLASKKELLDFKRSHNEREWEEEILRRQDLLTKKIDMERLKKMQGGASAAAPAAKGKQQPARKATVPVAVSKPATAATSAVAKKGKQPAKAASESDDSDLFSDSESEKSLFSSSSDDEEEEEEEKDHNTSAAEPSTIASSAKRATRAKAATSRYDSGSDDILDSSEEENDDDDDEEESDGARKKGKSLTKKGARTTASTVKRGKASTSATNKSSTTASATAMSSALNDSMDLDVEIPTKVKRSQLEADDDDGELDSVSSFNSRSDTEEKTKKSNRTKKSVDPEEEKPAKLENYWPIQLRRNQIERYLREPYFESAVQDMFVRLHIGEANGVEVYRMACIAGIETGRKYKLLNGKATTTRLRLDVAGNIRKHIKIVQISNHKITELEFQDYLDAINKSPRYTPLTIKETRERRSNLVSTVKRTYTHEEISDMVKRQRGLNKSVVTEYSTAMNSLLKKREKAVAAQDVDELEQVNKAIEELEAKIAEEKEIFEKSTSFQYVSLNARNREANFRKDLKAAEVQRKREKSRTASGPTDDPFVRRETTGHNLWKTGVKLEIEKLRSDRDAIALDLSKEKAKATPDTFVISKLEERIASLNSQLGAKGYQEAEAPKAGAKGAKAADEQVKATKTGLGAATEKENWKLSRLSLDQVRNNVKKRLRFDPYELSKMDKRNRYLFHVCEFLPPIGSQEREQLRKGLSLTEVFQRIAQRDSEDMDMAT